MTNRELLHAFRNLEIAVIGDLMMDEYVWGDASRVSPESPVLVIDVQRESAVPGGAANVAANIIALGAKVSVFGAVGDDQHGRALAETLREKGANVDGVVVDKERRTTRKTRVVAQNQQVLRVDRESTEPMNEMVSKQIFQKLQRVLDSTSAVLISDYAKGVVNLDLVPPIIQAVKSANKPIIANGKPDNAALFRHASILSFNLNEALAASGDKQFRTDAIAVAGAALRSRLEVETLVVTRGPKGLSAWNSQEDVLTVPAHSVEVYDVAGAGDTVIATLTLATAAGATLEQSLKLATIAAAIVVGKVGVATVSAQEILNLLEEKNKHQ